MSANYQTSGHAPAPILGPDGNPLSGVGPSTAEPSAGGQPLVAPSDANAAEATAVSTTSAVSPAETSGSEARPAPAAPAVMPAAGPTMVPAQMAPLVQGVPLVMPQGFAPQVMAPQALAPQALAPQTLAPQPVAPQAVSDGSMAAPMGASPAAIAPSQSCDCVGVRPSQAMGESPVFVIGRLFYDFESEARFDYFVQAIAEWRKRVDPQHYDPAGDYAAPWNAEIMIKFLLFKDKAGVLSNFPDSNALIWTLTIDTVPIYAIKPHHAFGLPMHLELVSLLWHQEVVGPFTVNA